jgi:hypothetical protein
MVCTKCGIVGADVLGIGMPRIFEDIKMWGTAVAMLVATGFGLGAASGASAAPANGSAIAESGQRIDPVIQIRQGCGLGRHRNLGHCVPGCGFGWFQPYPDAACRPR